MAQLDFDKLIKQENRRLQGIISGTNIHINCQAVRNNRDNEFDLFKESKIYPIGEIEAIVKIKDASSGIYSPCYYQITVEDVLGGLFPNDLEFTSNIKYLISYIGSYSCVFKEKERVNTSGILVRIENKSGICYGIELTPWNTNRAFSAVLLNL